MKVTYLFGRTYGNDGTDVIFDNIDDTLRAVVAEYMRVKVTNADFSAVINLGRMVAQEHMTVMNEILAKHEIPAAVTLLRKPSE